MFTRAAMLGAVQGAANTTGGSCSGVLNQPWHDRFGLLLFFHDISR